MRESLERANTKSWILFAAKEAILGMIPTPSMSFMGS
jgi:hypothetical protein